MTRRATPRLERNGMPFRLRTWALRTAAVVVLATIFALGTIGALLLHANLPVARRVIAGATADLLGQTFLGSFQIGSIERVDRSGAVLRNAVVRDPSGRIVLTVSRLRAQADVPRIFWDILFGPPELDVLIEHAAVDRAEAWLFPEARGIPSIAEAFTPRPSPAAGGSSGPPRRVRVVIRDMELSRGFARGAFAGLPTLEGDVSGVRGTLRVTPDGTRLLLRRFGSAVRGFGGADLRGIASLRLRYPGWLSITLDGYFGELPVGALLRMDGDRMFANLDVPRARPAEVRAFLPEYPLLRDASAHFEASGTTALLETSARIEVGKAFLLARGPMRPAADWDIALEAVGSGLDLAALDPDAPSTALDLAAQIRLRNTPRGVELQADGRVPEALIAGIATPALDVVTRVVEREVVGHARAHERGVPIAIDFARRRSGELLLDAHADRFRMERSPRIAAEVAMRGELGFDLEARLLDGKLQADLDAETRDFRYGEVSLARGRLKASASGVLGEPSKLRLDATLNGTRLGAGAFSFAQVEAALVGGATRPKLTAKLSDERGPSLDLAGFLTPLPGGAKLEELTLGIRRGKAELTGSVARIELSAGRAQIDRLALTTSHQGTLAGSAQITPRLVAFELQGSGLDLAEISDLAGVPGLDLQGRLTVDADVVLADDVQRGSLRAGLEKGKLGTFTDVSGSARVEIDDGRIELDAEASAPAVGSAEARVRGSLGGSRLTEQALRDMAGEGRLHVKDADLAVLGRAFPAIHRFGEVTGKLDAELKLERPRHGATPSGSLVMATRRLRVERSKVTEAAWLADTDLRVGLNWDGETGRTELSAKVFDQHGALASGSARTTLDLGRLLREPAAARELLTNAPLVAKAVVEERPLDRLPDLVRPTGFTGRLRAEVTLQGSWREPRLSGRARLAGFEVAELRSERPLDLCASFGWEGTTGRASAGGEVFLPRRRHRQIACSGRRVARFSAHGSFDPNAGGRPALSGAASAAFEGLPLAAVPGFGDRGVDGRLWGQAAVTETQGVPLLSAHLELRDLAFERVTVGNARLDLRSNPDAIGGTLELVHGRGRLSATALAKLDSSGSFPVLARDQAIGVRLLATQMDAVVLAPALRDVLTDLSGRIDAELVTSLSRNEQGKYVGSFDGHVELKDGRLQIAGLGLTLQDVELSARAQAQGGQTRVFVGRIDAAAGNDDERIRVSNTELWFDGLDLARASGTLHAEDLPLVLEGVSQATATTRQGIDFRIRRTPARMEAAFDIPYAVIALPQATARDLLPIAENRSIEIVQPLGAPRLRSTEGLPWQFTVRLGDQVKLTRSDLDLPLQGTIEVLLADEVTVSGSVRLRPGGRVQVSGKTFVIEFGEVYFDTGDAENPRLRVTATWRAPDGTTVIADLRGTFQEAKLRLSSDPARSEQEIYALLLGGSGSAEGGSAQVAGAGVGADLLGSLLVNTPLNRVEFRAGSEQSADQRQYATYTAAVPVSEEVWFEGSYKSLSSNEPSEQKPAFSGTIDWRFRRNWSLRTEVGTIGTGVDLLWQYRY